jgi:hypothetical protein
VPLVIAVLGVNLWVGLLALPLWHLRELGSFSHVAAWTAFAALVPLAIGTVLLVRRDRGASEALLVAFPAATFLTLALQPSLAGSSVFSPAATAIVGVSFAGYVVGAGWACHRAGASTLVSRAEPLESPPRHSIRPWPAVVLAFGAVLAALVIGAGHIRPSTSIGAAAAGGADARVVVVSAGALLLWTGGFFWVLAPSLRDQRQRPLALPSRGAALVWLLVVALAGVMLLLSSLE